MPAPPALPDLPSRLAVRRCRRGRRRSQWSDPRDLPRIPARGLSMPAGRLAGILRGRLTSYLRRRGPRSAASREQVPLENPRDTLFYSPEERTAGPATLPPIFSLMNSSPYSRDAENRL